ncbi:MAG: hypothetical protein MET45_13290 [Nostoc sp. LLA-1]|nr:hypothetical protein [Cyanocohniella sp. LLY]
MHQATGSHGYYTGKTLIFRAFRPGRSAKLLRQGSVQVSRAADLVCIAA